MAHVAKVAGLRDNLCEKIDELEMAKEFRVNRTGLVVLIAVGALVLLFLLYTSRGSGYVETTVKISELLSVSIALAEEAGRMVVSVRDMGDSEIGQLSKGMTKEGKSEYVTLGDTKSHEIITSGLKARWPNLRYQSEETDRKIFPVRPPSTMNTEVMSVAKRDEEVLLEAITVWIDPLDATQEYTEGHSQPELLQYVTVMVCIAIEGQPIAGVIHQPYAKSGSGEQGVTKWGWVSHGVSRSLLESMNPSPKDSNKVRVIASRSHPGEVVSIANAAFKGWKTVEQITAAGAGYKALAVAEKYADLYLHTTAIKKWDICAGDAVLRTIGGKMTTGKGKELDYSLGGDPKNSDGIVAAFTEEEHGEYLAKLALH